VFIALAIGPTFDPYSNTTTDVLRQLEAGSVHECFFTYMSHANESFPEPLVIKPDEASPGFYEKRSRSASA